MIWQDDYVVILKGTELNSPGADGSIITLPIRGVKPKVRLLGDVQQGGDGMLFGRVDKHIELVVFPKPFTVLEDADERLQSHGSLWYLTYSVLPSQFVHVLGAYTSLAASGGLPDSNLPRSIIESAHATNPVYSDLFWQSLLPMTCVLDGEVSSSENYDSGTDEIDSFTLVKSYPE